MCFKEKIGHTGVNRMPFEKRKESIQWKKLQALQ